MTPISSTRSDIRRAIEIIAHPSCSRLHSQIGSAGVTRLVHADLAAARQPKAGDPTPPLLCDVLGELNTPGPEITDRGIEFVAHEVELVGRRLRGMNRQLRGRQPED